MIFDTITKSLQFVLAADTTANPLECVANWVDMSEFETTPASTNLFVVNTTPVDVVPPPGAGVQRVLRSVSLFNADTVSASVTVRFHSAGSDSTVHQVLLAANQSLCYTPQMDWHIRPGDAANAFDLRQVANVAYAGSDRWGYANNRIHVNENVDVTGATAPIANGLVVEVYPGIGGTNKSNVISLLGAVTLEAGASIDTSNPALLDIVGVQAYAKASRNWGGTNTGAGAAGGLFGANIVVINNTTNLLGTIGCEVDVQTVAGSTQARRIGMTVVDFTPSNSQGSTWDAAFNVGGVGGGVGWLNGFLVSDCNGTHPLDTTNGCVLGVQGGWTTKYGVNLIGANYTAAAFQSNGFVVDGTGAVTINNGMGISGGINIVTGGLLVTLGGMTVNGVTSFVDGITGVTTNSAAAAGIIGQLIASSVEVASHVSLSNAVVANVTSISVTAGDWDIEGWVQFDYDTSTSLTALIAGVSKTSATRPTATTDGAMQFLRFAAVVPLNSPMALPTGRMRFSFATTTTVYLVALAVFTVSTCFAYGRIEARRVR